MLQRTFKSSSPLQQMTGIFVTRGWHARFVKGDMPILVALPFVGLHGTGDDPV